MGPRTQGGVSVEVNSGKRTLERGVTRQRERYNTDPVYRAKVKAKKIRRKRAMQGTQVVPVNREIVAARDGWLCGICGGPVSREDWSLDHVIPLSKGLDEGIRVLAPSTRRPTT
jgi:5-methylcytosine-specific restriction endonuclease McrA